MQSSHLPARAHHGRAGARLACGRGRAGTCGLTEVVAARFQRSSARRWGTDSVPHQPLGRCRLGGRSWLKGSASRHHPASRPCQTKFGLERSEATGSTPSPPPSRGHSCLVLGTSAAGDVGLRRASRGRPGGRRSHSHSRRAAGRCASLPSAGEAGGAGDPCARQGFPADDLPSSGQKVSGLAQARWTAQSGRIPEGGVRPGRR